MPGSGQWMSDGSTGCDICRFGDDNADYDGDLIPNECDTCEFDANALRDSDGVAIDANNDGLADEQDTDNDGQ